MSPRVRQLFAFTAVSVFLLLATYLTLHANGWQWAGWRQGFVPSGVIVLSSSPRSTVIINGKTIGPTPRRISNLAPGIYTVELSATGLQPWRQYVHVQANQADVIGPVVLLPVRPTILPVSGSAANLMMTEDQSKGFISTESNNQVQFRQVWPSTAHLSFTLEEKPEHLAVSPNGQLVVSTTQSESSLTMVGKATPAWPVKAITGAFWLSGSDQVVYGIRDQELWRLDAVSETETLVGPALQAGAIEQDVWRSTMDKDQTVIWRQPTFTASVAREILRQTGSFTISAGPDRALIMHDTGTASTTIVIFPTTGEPKRIELGQADRVVWTTANERPLWTKGLELWSLDNRGLPTLIDRRASQPEKFGWLSSPDILSTTDTDGLTISSVSDRQGRGTIMESPTQSGQTIIQIAPNLREALVAGPAVVEVWRW